MPLRLIATAMKYALAFRVSAALVLRPEADAIPEGGMAVFKGSI